MAVISNAKLSNAVDANRLDAEFFDPADLSLIRKLAKEGGQALGSICEVLNGLTPKEYLDDGDIPVVRSGDLVAPFIYPECGQPFLRTNKGSSLVYLKAGDVLVSSIGMGSIGKISIVMNADVFATVSEVTILRPKGYPSEVLFAYLTTLAGQRQIARQITGATGQQHLLKSKVKTILVPPIPAPGTVTQVRAACEKAWQLEIAAKAELARVHSLFAQTAGIMDSGIQLLA